MQAIPLLDHGYVRFIEDWGRGDAGLPEAGIIEAARQSTQGSFRGWESDLKLLRYLHEHKHSTPFEFAGMTIEVQAPIFVFREWHRHRTQSYNEMSARYEPLPDLNYLPTVERLMMNAMASNRQANRVTGAPELERHNAERFRERLAAKYAQDQELYEDALSVGVPKELARVGLPVGRYSRMRATANLRNWLAFMTLRCDPAAQWEIRQYANTVLGVCFRRFPHTSALFVEGAKLEEGLFNG